METKSSPFIVTEETNFIKPFASVFFYSEEGKIVVAMDVATGVGDEYIATLVITQVWEGYQYYQIKKLQE
jgi:hypothetical protein